MTVAINATSTVTNSEADAATSTMPTFAAGNYLLCSAMWGNTEMTAPTISAGWTLLGSVVGTGTFAQDAGPRGVTVWGKVAVTGDTGPVVTQTGTGGTNRTLSVAVTSWSKTLGFWVDPSFAGGSDNTVNTAFSVTATSDPGAAVGDALFIGIVLSVDTASETTPTLTWPGTTGTGVTALVSSMSVSGFDQRVILRRRTASPDAASTGAPTYASTLAAAAQGSVAFVRLRDTNTAPPARSRNIRASNPATPRSYTW